MELRVNVKENSYPVILKEGALEEVASHIAFAGRKVMIITDTGTPKAYLECLKAQMPGCAISIVDEGEGSKSFSVYERLCLTLLENNFHRDDLVIALGGGVVGDLAGFVSATYMRGIDFVNIPTTSLAQIDSSIGGKTAINLGSVKNIVGAFHQPKAVIIDPALLATLPLRQLNNGLVEALKAGLIYDRELFDIFDTKDIRANLNEIIQKAVLVKKDVVEKDEKENHLRKILNFGHTIGHGLEGYFRLEGILHGEAVAAGMLSMIEDDVLRKKVKHILRDKLGIETDIRFDADKVFALMMKDKKAADSTITVVKVPEAGTAKLERISMEACKKYLSGPWR